MVLTICRKRSEEKHAPPISSEQRHLVSCKDTRGRVHLIFGSAPLQAFLAFFPQQLEKVGWRSVEKGACLPLLKPGEVLLKAGDGSLKVEVDRFGTPCSSGQHAGASISPPCTGSILRSWFTLFFLPPVILFPDRLSPEEQS